LQTKTRELQGLAGFLLCQIISPDTINPMSMNGVFDGIGFHYGADTTKSGVTPYADFPLTWESELLIFWILAIQRHNMSDRLNQIRAKFPADQFDHIASIFSIGGIDPHFDQFVMI
jgi:hypothetical protein